MKVAKTGFQNHFFEFPIHHPQSLFLRHLEKPQEEVAKTGFRSGGTWICRRGVETALGDRKKKRFEKRNERRR